jgi:hypothetical protein
MPFFSADIETPHASKYLQQLCKHFAHKVTVDFSPEAGRVEFPPGRCIMAADGTRLQFHCKAKEDRAIPMIKGILENHLVKFAWREELSIEWVNQVPEDICTELLSPAFMPGGDAQSETEERA